MTTIAEHLRADSRFRQITTDLYHGELTNDQSWLGQRVIRADQLLVDKVTTESATSSRPSKRSSSI